MIGEIVFISRRSFRLSGTAFCAHSRVASIREVSSEFASRFRCLESLRPFSSSTSHSIAPCRVLAGAPGSKAICFDTVISAGMSSSDGADKAIRTSCTGIPSADAMSSWDNEGSEVAILEI